MSDTSRQLGGIYDFLLSDRTLFEKLNLRTFDPDDMRVAYENQKGVCPICKGKFAFEEMRGDHIKPWSKGGKTKPENLQMLCADCNARKSKCICSSSTFRGPKIDIIREMKLLTMILLLPVTAVAVTVTPLPPSEYADTEVSTNIPFAVDFAAMSRMNFTVSLDASPSNSVEVSIGEDANGDGNLSLEEADQAFGYNCGKWFLRDSAAELFDCSDCSVVRLGGTERAEKTFVLKKRRLDEAWNLVKVTRRGVAIGEVVLVEGRKPGFAVEVR